MIDLQAFLQNHDLERIYSGLMDLRVKEFDDSVTWIKHVTSPNSAPASANGFRCSRTAASTRAGDFMVGVPFSVGRNIPAEWFGRIHHVLAVGNLVQTRLRHLFQGGNQPQSRQPQHGTVHVRNEGTRTMANFFVGHPIGSTATNPSLAGGLVQMRQGNGQHWNFAIQRDLGHNSALEVDSASQARRPYPTFGGIIYNAQGALPGGWQVQSILVARIGRPFTPTIALPVSFTYGNSGANILREDRFQKLDFSLFKQFQVSERGRVPFRAEAFNLTNGPSFSAPSRNIDIAMGGVVNSTLSAPRTVQLALKFGF